MAQFTTDTGEMVTVTERYVVMAGMPTSASTPYGLKVKIRYDDTEEREQLKARGYRYLASEQAWMFPGRKAECAAEMAHLVNEREYSIPGPRLIAGDATDFTNEVKQLAGLTVAAVFPNPLFSE